jgi:hypothetical protein
MPCWTRVESKVEFLAASTNVDLLDAALVAMGHRVAKTARGLSFTLGRQSGSYEASTGKLTAYADLDTAEVKRQYSEGVVNHTAKKNGWQISWSTNEKTGNREAAVVKRGF